MRRLVTVSSILLGSCLIFSSCTIHNRYYRDGPDASPLTAYGVSHVMVTVPIVFASGVATGRPFWGALGSCAFYLGHETEETRTWKYFEWGIHDSVADVVFPCLTGFALDRLLQKWSWWKFWRRDDPQEVPAGTPGDPP
jgi:hypothetical protein